MGFATSVEGVDVWTGKQPSQGQASNSGCENPVAYVRARIQYRYRYGVGTHCARVVRPSLIRTLSSTPPCLHSWTGFGVFQCPGDPQSRYITNLSLNHDFAYGHHNCLPIRRKCGGPGFTFKFPPCIIGHQTSAQGLGTLPLTLRMGTRIEYTLEWTVSSPETSTDL